VKPVKSRISQGTLSPVSPLAYGTEGVKGRSPCKIVLEKNTKQKKQNNTQTHKHKCKDYYLLLNYEFFSHLSHLSLVCAAFQMSSTR
jgi:hypothetical protein